MRGNHRKARGIMPRQRKRLDSTPRPGVLALIAAIVLPPLPPFLRCGKFRQKTHREDPFLTFIPGMQRGDPLHRKR
jgi:hypothetical protein